MHYARCLPYSKGDTFPAIMHGEVTHFPCSEKLYEYWLPDQIEDDEFNMVILYDGNPIIARSCHFDFCTQNKE